MMICYAKTKETKGGLQLLAFNHRRVRLVTQWAKDAGVFGCDIQDLVDFTTLPHMSQVQNGTAPPGPLERDISKLLKDGPIEPDC